jgi:hypothetical protein
MIPITAKILSILLYLVQIFVNINYGLEIAKVSNSLNLTITPSSWVFSIWLVIYSFQLYMLLGISNKDIYKIFIPHALTVLFNIAWIFAFVNMKLGLATIFILALLASITYVLVNKKTESINIVKQFYSLYFGWISVASFLTLTGWIVVGLGINFNQIGSFILYTFYLIKTCSLNLWAAIPYILVYFDLIFVDYLSKID